MHVLTSEIDQLGLPAEMAHRESIVTIGAFDGIHIGHQALIERLVDRARQQDRLAGLVTFYPHPAAILSPRRPLPYLTTPGEKMALLESSGLDWLAILPFTVQLAATTPRDFVEQLHVRVKMRELWVGTDFALGRERKGDVATLRLLGQEIGFAICDIPYVLRDQEKVSSTYIRDLLRRGHVEETTRLLGRYYSIYGEVVHGAQRGRCLGFPTANVLVPADRVIPADGIYATFAYLGSECYSSVTNVGVRPSFDNGERSIEAYLLDYSGDLYGCDLAIAFVARLRPEKRFRDIQALIAQIGQDVKEARQILDASAIPTALGQIANQITDCRPSTVPE